MPAHALQTILKSSGIKLECVAVVTFPKGRISLADMGMNPFMGKHRPEPPQGVICNLYYMSVRKETCEPFTFNAMIDDARLYPQGNTFPNGQDRVTVCHKLFISPHHARILAHQRARVKNYFLASSTLKSLKFFGQKISIKTRH